MSTLNNTPESKANLSTQWDDILKAEGLGTLDTNEPDKKSKSCHGRTNDNESLDLRPGKTLERLTIKSDLERICPYCGAINPCAGSYICGQCGRSLKRARRLPRSQSSRHSDPRALR